MRLTPLVTQFSVLVLIGTSSLALSLEETKIRGTGASLCREFNKLRSEGTPTAKRAELAHFQWAYGFLASAQLYTDFPKSVAREPQENEQFLGLISQYCLSHEDARFFEAVIQSMKKLSKSEDVGAR